MKKCLIVLAALSLAGCVHSQFRAGYLQEFATLDCSELNAQRLEVESKLDPKWTQVASNTGNSSLILFFADTHLAPGDVYSFPPVYYSYDPGEDPSIGDHSSKKQKTRMRRHAKWQALLQLQQSKGCLNSLIIQPAGESPSTGGM